MRWILFEIWYAWLDTKLSFLRIEYYLARFLGAKQGGLWFKGMDVRMQSLKAEFAKKRNK